MAKAKTAFVCNDCGADFNKWQGQCGECRSWNTLQEVKLSASNPRAEKFSGYAGGSPSQITALGDIDLQALPRLSSGLQEFDRVLGGGFVPGSVVMIGGHPGAGKSTLLLQTVNAMAKALTHLIDGKNLDADGKNQTPVLYVTGEESLQQVALRAKRLDLPATSLQLLSATDVESVVTNAQRLKPKVMVVDSIQVMHHADIQSAAGSVSQVRESAAVLTRFAKNSSTIVILVGHVTKEGQLAGPKVLEHMIDCSIMLEGSNDSRFRTLRGIKNRFGAVNELGVFAMTEQGLKEVTNPSAIFLQRTEDVAAGSVVMVLWEGTRPLLVELQALVDSSSLGNPRRVSVGLDQNRLSMLLAVLHRHGGFMFGDQDVFVNVVGGVKVMETSADLAILLALVSSFRDVALPRDLIAFGEVGLAGEIRPVPSGIERVREAAKHGFTRAIVPVQNAPREAIKGMEVIKVKRLSEAIEAIA